MTTPVTILEADLARDDHQRATLDLLNTYASDPFGDGKPLSDLARRALIPGLRAHPTTHVFLAYREAEPVGLAICFRGFSTFAARPLLNIHDLFVAPKQRGEGIARLLFEAIAQRARELDCCKLTLEVLEYNHRARHVYAAAGFAPPGGIPEAGLTYYLTKSL